MKTNYLIFIVIFSKTKANVFLEEKGKEWYDSKEWYSDSDIVAATAALYIMMLSYKSSAAATFSDLEKYVIIDRKWKWKTFLLID